MTFADIKLQHKVQKQVKLAEDKESLAREAYELEQKLGLNNC
jgi:hypothetical protein